MSFSQWFPIARMSCLLGFCICFEFVVDGWRRCVCGEVYDGDEFSLVAAGADGDVALFLEIEWVSMFFRIPPKFHVAIF